ncbi:MAG: oxidoreductase [Bacteroidetes bacterium]|nr:MAG: oxidoreductase [Bacteroidota bacterium]
MLRVGIVGFGISAKVFHAPFITTMPGKYELVAVLERSRNESKEKYPFVKVVRTMDELLSDPSIDLIIVTTPNDTHFPYTKMSLQAGRSVVLEKPFTVTTIEGLELVNLAKKSRGVLSVYQNRRYVGDFLTIREILSQKMLGDIHTYDAHYDRYRAEARPQAWREAPEPGSGILYDLGAHLIDQSFCLFGLPKNILADVRLQRPHARVDDFFDMWLDYGFLKVHLHSGMLVREPGPRFMIHGTQGSFIKNGEDPQEALLRAGELPIGKDWGKDPESLYGYLHSEIDGKMIRDHVPTTPGNFGLYYENLYKTIVEGAPLREKPEHGYNTIRLIELAFESSKQKKQIPCEGFIDVEY